MCKFLKIELRKIFKTPFFIIMTALFLFSILFGAIYVEFSSSSFQEKTQIKYGVEQYVSFEELEQRIAKEKENLEIEEKMLQESISINDYSDIIEEKQIRIDNMKTNIYAMQVLLEKRINYDNVQAYRNFSINNGASILLSFNGIGAIIIFFISAIKISLIIPSEIKEGQAKFTFILPMGRIKYALYKLFANITSSFSLLILCSFFATIICSIFFPIKNVFIIFASPYKAICLSFLSSMFLQLVFSLITLTAFCSFAFAISLLFQNQIISLLITLIFVFWGSIINMFSNILGNKLEFLKYLLAYNLHIDKIFYNQNANPIWLSGLILAMYLGIFVPLALVKFKKQDILN